MQNKVTMVTEVAKNDTAVANKNEVNIVKKDYFLNDIEALKKTMNNEEKKPELGISGEAIDGSCTTICMKTSLFKY